MRRRLVPLLLVGCAIGCGTSPAARFYTLDATARPDGTPPAACSVVVGPVSIPPAVDRPQLVLQVAPNRVTVDEFNRWAAPLDDGVARAIAGNLAVLLGTSQVAASPATGVAPTHRVTVDVQRFESRPGEGVLVEALWVVRPSAGGEATAGRTVATEPVQGKEADAVAAAYSRALATVSADVAAAIRTPAGGRRPPAGGRTAR
jgi:uncharacterized lipoprotein YmbA